MGEELNIMISEKVDFAGNYNKNVKLPSMRMTGVFGQAANDPVKIFKNELSTIDETKREDVEESKLNM